MPEEHDEIIEFDIETYRTIGRAAEASFGAMVTAVEEISSGWGFAIPDTPATPDYAAGVDDRGRIRCVCTSCADRRDRGVSTVMVHRRQANGEERERYAGEVIECADPTCEVRAARGSFRERSGAFYCHGHIDYCVYCSRSQPVSEMHNIIRPRYNEAALFCSSCSFECSDCEERTAEPDMRRTYDGARLCPDCSQSCDNCSSNVRAGGECGYCDSRIVGLSGYGKTHAERWLGGPLPKNKKGIERGYYLGIELEVSARAGNVKVLHDWAEKGLGYNDAIDCKEDSSVQGFEIATQPMTPEFFESVDWDEFFKVLNKNFPLKDRKRTEPEGHGLHVHIGRTAFAGDDIAMAAFCYLIGQSTHLERIARRKPTNYCVKVTKPVSAAIRSVRNSSGKYHIQADRAARSGVYADRNAINLLNGSTIEIRAFRSTRKPQDLKDAVRLVYVAAEYIRYLRFSNVGVPPKALHWNEFTKWVGANYPDAFESIADLRKRKLPVRRG